MSFEGYYQFLCKKGHYYTESANSARFYLFSPRDQDVRCPYCGEKIVWYNLVDLTNGSFEGNRRIDGYVELKLLKERVCDKCGSVLERIYKLPPKNKGIHLK